MKHIVILFLLLQLSGCKNISSLTKNTDDIAHPIATVKTDEISKANDVTPTANIKPHYNEIGIASWYGGYFHCRQTANGEYFNKHEFSAAHRTLPLPSIVKVTNLTNNRSIEIIVNDRGPYINNRIIDLSEKSASELGMRHHGLAKVRVELLTKKTSELLSNRAANKKIYYKTKIYHKFEIIVTSHQDKKMALLTMRKISKLGKVHLLDKKNHYTVILIIKNKSEAKISLAKIINMGYKNAKIHTH